MDNRGRSPSSILMNGDSGSGILCSRFYGIKSLGFIFSFLFYGLAVAGGDSVLGKVGNFSGEDGNYSFSFIQTDEHSPLMPGCRQLEVTVEYGRVPWYSWLPFVETSHPSLEETDEAAFFLLEAQREGREVHFGYMGGGLIPVDKPCFFVSKGLLLYPPDKKDQVISFHDSV